MKTIILAFGLLILPFAGSFAQENDRNNSHYPYWTISKEVQRMNFRNTAQSGQTITTSNSALISKDVNRIHAKSVRTGFVKTTGTPEHVISKGLARMQYKKRSR